MFYLTYAFPVPARPFVATPLNERRTSRDIRTRQAAARYARVLQAHGATAITLRKRLSGLE